MMTLEPPTEEQLARIYKELGMSAEAIERDVVYLKDCPLWVGESRIHPRHPLPVDWVSKQPHLPSSIDDRFLRNSLIFRKNSLEKVKQTVDLFYSVKSHIPELLSNRDPLLPALQGEMENLFCYPLPKLTPDGSRVIIFKLFATDPKLFHYPTAAKLALMMAAVNLLEDRCLNHTIVFDLQGITMGHLATVHVPLARKFLYVGQKVYPIRQKAVHIIYAPSYVEAMLSIFKPFLKKKLVDRIHIHPGGLGSIFDALPRSIFPVDYGGDEISLRAIQQKWRSKLVEYRSWFLEDDKKAVDERMRPGKPRTHYDLFGFEGSFRQLSVD